VSGRTPQKDFDVANKKKQPNARAPKKTQRKAETVKAETIPHDAMTMFLARGRKVNADSVTYIMRCCSPQMEGHGGFKWPGSGAVSCPDWNERAECGNGLHGWLMGEGDIGVSDHATSDGAKWLVCAVWSADVVDLGQKVKFPRAWVVFCGDKHAASAEIRRLGANGAVIASTLKAGDNSTLKAGWNSTLKAGVNSTLEAGDSSTLKAGDSSTLKAGDSSTLEAGWNSTLKAGANSTLEAGENSTLKAGVNSTLEAGWNSTLKAGWNSTLKAGDSSTLKAGDSSTLEAGDNSTLEAGWNSRLKAGENSTLEAGVNSTLESSDYDRSPTAMAGDEGTVFVLRRWNGSRWKVHTAVVGQNGIEPGVKYKVGADGAWIRVDKNEAKS